MTWTRNRPTGLVYIDREQSLPGYTLFCTVRGKYATLLDWDGRIVHRWHHEDGIQHVKILDNGNLLVQTKPTEEARGAQEIGGSAAALLELDWDSNVVWEHRDDYMHHDYQRLSSGNTLFLRWEEMPPGVKEQVGGGHDHEGDPAWMWGDTIREVDPAGEVVRDWCSWEHLDFAEDVICPLESRREWTHANSLEVLPDGRWLISFRLTSTVAIINPATGAFDWKWGPEFEWKAGLDGLSHQHAATWLEEGRVLLFDNGCHRKRAPSFSRVLEVDPATNEIGWN